MIREGDTATLCERREIHTGAPPNSSGVEEVGEGAAGSFGHLSATSENFYCALVDCFYFFVQYSSSVFVFGIIIFFKS